MGGPIRETSESNRGKDFCVDVYKRHPLYGKNMTYGLVDVVGQYFAGGWDAHWSHKLREYDYKHMEVRPEIDAIWESMYKGISYVNNMLENLAERDSSAFALYNVYKACLLYTS